MDEEDGHFGERVAATYDETSAEMFDAVVNQGLVSHHQHVSVWQKGSG